MNAGVEFGVWVAICLMCIGSWVSIGCGLVSISVGVWEFVDGLRLVWDLS